MSSEKIYISISLEPDQDSPIADLVYSGVQWASMTLTSRGPEVTFYGDLRRPSVVPLVDAIRSLEQAQDRLGALAGDDASGASAD